MKTYWVIQGHTQYVTEVLENFKNVDNVIWSTEDDIPEDDRLAIDESNIELLQIPRSESSYGRLTIHSDSACAGIQRAKELGAEYVIKLRSDLTISDHDKFLKVIRRDGKLHGHAYVNHVGRFCDPPHVISHTYNWLYQFRSKLYNFSNCNYITDWIHHGPVDEVLLYYGGVLRDRLDEPIICEVRFAASYLMNKNLPIDLSYASLTNNIGLFMGNLYDNNIELYSLKEDFNYSRMFDKSYLPKAVPEAYLR